MVLKYTGPSTGDDDVTKEMIEAAEITQVG